MLLAFEEAIGFCLGDVVNDKDGVSASAVFAEMAGWLRRERDRSVVEHLFCYALGREVGFADDEELDRLLEQVKASGYRAQAAVRSIVTSPSFLSK